MANPTDAVQYLLKHAALATKSADECNAFGRIGSDDAEAMEKPLREHAAHLIELARAVQALEFAARAVFAAKGRHHTQLAMCDLGDLLGIETTRP